MGMDIHGLNPKENKTYDDFPTLLKLSIIDPDERIEILAKDDELNDKYWKEKVQNPFYKDLLYMSWTLSFVSSHGRHEKKQESHFFQYKI